MGKYFDDYEREADYQNWLYYRESSHEERESKSRHVRSDEAKMESKPKLAIQQTEWPVVDVFHDYPEHKAQVAAAEKKYFEDKLKLHLSEDDEKN
ncbi:TPA: hypothetical protein PFE28_001879 [Kluyvera cryocrescens]|nr:hypothetical protein [Kluyvera cryocrescens]